MTRSKPSHPNVPKIVGISGENISESPFIVFHGSGFLAFSTTHYTHGDISIRKENELFVNPSVAYRSK